MNYDDREVNRGKSRQDREDRGRIARIAAGSRGSQQGLLRWDCNFFLYLGCLWSDLQTVFSKMMEIHS